MSLPRAPLAVAFVAACLAGCGGSDPETVDRVLHLDPRLEDGRSPAAVLAGATPLATRFDLGEEGPWSLVENGDRRALQLAGPIDAADYRYLQLSADGGALRFHATWSTDAGIQEHKGAFRPTEKPGIHIAALVDAEGWRGDLRDLIVRFEPDPALAIRGATLRSTAADLGAEPLGRQDLDASERSGDAGLVASGFEVHRAWPSSRDVPLVADVTVPRDGRVVTHVATLDGRPAVFSVSVDGASLAEVEAGDAWVRLEADLTGFAGDDVTLTFLARDAGASMNASGVSATPRDAEVLFGEPVVLGARPAGKRPNVILITLDTTRGDVLGQGYTPHLDALSERGTTFERAFATTNSTVPSHASIFTGMPLSEHGALGNRHAFAVENLTLAERMRALGYHTSAAVSVGLLRPGFGFGQGFDRYELPHPEAYRDGAPATRAAERWIAEHGENDTPFFLWLHLFDAHTPYGPPDEFADAFLSKHGKERPPRHVEPATMPVWDLPPAQLTFAEGISNLEWMRFEYELGVAYADQLVGRVLAGLDDAGITENTLVVVTADHGESFGERDFWFEHGNLFPEVIHVPLILAGPGVPAGKRVAHEVSTIDLLPTILHAAGRRDSKLAGVDLREIAQGGDAPARRIWFQLSDGRQAGYRDHEVHFVTTLTDGLRWIAGSERNDEGLRVPRFVTEMAGTHHLFDLLTDPDATEDLGEHEPARSAVLKESVTEWLESRKTAHSALRDISAVEEQMLEDLGYAGDG